MEFSNQTKLFVEDLIDDLDYPKHSLKNIDSVLETLTPNEAFVFRKRYEGLSLRNIGRLLLVTPERVRQIEAKAVRKMRHPSRMRIIQAKMTLEEYNKLHRVQ